jgi:putative inorganic carbon (hco3(-)) transporter
MSLRELFVILTVVVVAFAALFRPLWGVYGYVWFALMRPDYLSWSTNKYPFSMMLSIASLIGAVRYLPQLSVLFANPLARRLMLLVIPITLSVWFCEGRFLAQDRYSAFVRLCLMVLLIPLTVRTPRDVRILTIIMALSLGGLGARFGLYGVAHGGVVFHEGIGDQYDNNTLGLVMAMSVPLCWYASKLTEWRWLSWILRGMVVTSSATVFMSNSRGASLSLAVGLALIVWRSKYKTAAAVGVAIAIIPLVYLVKDQYFARMSTIGNYQEEKSAANRLLFAKAAVAMWRDYPVLGVGYGSRNYISLNWKYLGYEDEHGVHNTYLQLLVDSGIFAYLIYASLLFGTVVFLGKSAKWHRQVDNGWQYLPWALQTALVVFLVGGTFGSCERMDIFYMLIMTAAAWWQVQYALDDAGDGFPSNESEGAFLPSPSGVA